MNMVKQWTNVRTDTKACFYAQVSFDGGFYAFFQEMTSTGKMGFLFWSWWGQDKVDCYQLYCGKVVENVWIFLMVWTGKLKNISAKQIRIENKSIELYPPSIYLKRESDNLFLRHWVRLHVKLWKDYFFTNAIILFSWYLLLYSHQSYVIHFLLYGNWFFDFWSVLSEFDYWPALVKLIISHR